MAEKQQERGGETETETVDSKGSWAESERSECWVGPIGEYVAVMGHAVAQLEKNHWLKKPTGDERYMPNIMRDVWINSFFIKLSQLSHALGSSHLLPEYVPAGTAAAAGTAATAAAAESGTATEGVSPVGQEIQSLGACKAFIAKWLAQIVEARKRLARLGDGLDPTRLDFPFRPLFDDARRIPADIAKDPKRGAS